MSISLVLRTSDKNRKAFNGFEWPASGPVECPDWDPGAHCGNGLHGLLWGQGKASLLSGEANATWQVVEVVTETIVYLSGKVKFPRGTVVYSGDRHGALQMVLQGKRRRDALLGTSTAGNYAHSSTAGDSAHSSTAGYYAHSSTAGDYAHSSTAGNSAHSSTAGDSAHSSTAGDYAHSSTAGNYAHSSTAGNSAHSSTAGNYAHSSTAGNYAHSSTAGDYARSSTVGNYAHSSTAGDYAHSSTAGDSAHSSTAGDYSIAAGFGLNSQVQAGEKGVIVASYWDRKGDRLRVLTGYVGELGIEAGKRYEVKVLASGKAKWREVRLVK